MGHIPGRDEEPTVHTRQPPPSPPSDETIRRGWIAFGSLIAAVAVIGVAVAVFTSDTGSSGSSSDDWGAHNACTQFVERQLRSPSTADFPAHRDADISQSGDRYTVRSYVDAENAFGATIRNDWTCTVSPTDDGWEGNARLLE